MLLVGDLVPFILKVIVRVGLRVVGIENISTDFHLGFNVVC